MVIAHEPTAGTPGSAPQVSRVDTTTDDALAQDDMTGLLERLHRREVSAEELQTAALERAETANRQLNAVTAWSREPGHVDVGGEGEEPLAGIPTFVKDNEAVLGYPTTEGSWAVPDRPAPQSGPWARQFQSLGVSVLGKTTLSEFGLTASTETARFGATRNPWNTNHSAGGSSGGSAALVAAGVVPIAHGNDGGGSLRIPASCCGLVGLKPSRGRTVDLPELDRMPVVLGVQGVLTRTVRDTARYLAEAERLYRNPALPGVGQVLNGEGPRLRIGLVTRTIRGLPVSAETVRTVERAGQVFESLGHVVEPTDPPVDGAFGPDFLRYWSFVAFVLTKTGRRLYGEGFDATRAEVITRGLSGRFLKSIERFPGSVRRLRRLAAAQEPSFSRFDVLLSPVLGHAPPPIGYLAPEVDFETHLARLLRYTSFTPVQNVSGSPALSLPMGRSANGVPLGVQVAAPLGHEARLLALGYELEEAAPWPLRVGAA
jgi:amidase